MLKEVDVIFLVEHKDRELDSIKLLAKKLKEENITSLILPVYFGLFFTLIYKAKLYVLFGIFFENHFPTGILKKYISNAKYMSMNWEQYLSPINIKFKKPRDSFTKEEVKHIAWDRIFYDYLVSSGVKKENISITGNIFDFLLHKYISEHKNVIYKNYSKKYNIDKYKKRIFFAMNLGWSFFGKNQIQFRLNMGYDKDILYDHITISKNYRKIMIKWILEASKKFDNYLFIIRPHPSASEKQYVDYIMKNHDSISNNILITKDETIKEWITISDKIYSNWSSTVKDALNNGKDASLIAPIKRPDWLNVIWNDEVNNIMNLHDFFEDLKTINKSNILNNKTINTIPDNITFFISEIMNIEHANVSIIKGLFQPVIFRQIIKNILCKYCKCFGVKNTKYDYFEKLLYE